MSWEIGYTLDDAITFASTAGKKKVCPKCGKSYSDKVHKILTDELDPRKKTRICVLCNGEKVRVA